MTWIDTLVVGIIATLGLLVMYRALKEPIDLLLGAIKRGFLWIADQIRGTDMGGTEEITYG